MSGTEQTSCSLAMIGDAGYTFATHDPYHTVRVTRRQMQVVTSLAGGDDTVGGIASDWPGMTDDMARSMVAALYRKGVVKPTRFDHRGREWGLTRLGSAMDNLLGKDDEGAQNRRSGPTCSPAALDEEMSDAPR